MFSLMSITRNEVSRIVDIFKNDGVDKITGKKVNESAIYDLPIKSIYRYQI